MASPNTYVVIHIVVFLTLWGLVVYLVFSMTHWRLVMKLLASGLAFLPLGYFTHWVLPRMTGPILKRMFRDS